MQYTGAKPKKGVQKIPQDFCTHNSYSCNSWAGSMRIKNDVLPICKLLEFTHLTIKSTFWRSFWEAPLYAQIVYSYIYENFTNESHCLLLHPNILKTRDLVEQLKILS